MNNSGTKRIRNIVNILLVVFGVLLMALALAADELGLDITPGFGVIQMVAFLAGLTLLTLGAFNHLYGLRPKDAPRSLQAEIATRLIATGLVLCYVTGLSDLIGIGTHTGPDFARPYVGPLQLGGIFIGGGLILFGLALYQTSRGKRTEFLAWFPCRGQAEWRKAARRLTGSEARQPYCRLSNWNGWFSTVNTAVSAVKGRWNVTAYCNV